MYESRSILSMTLLMMSWMSWTGCTLDEPTAAESVPEVPEVHDVLDDPALAGEDEVSAAADHGTLGCQASSTYDADVETVRDYIRRNCGGIHHCGNTESSSHSDVFLNSGNSYCSCYSMLFSNRTIGAFSRVQVIYHEPQACLSNGVPNHHIHIEKKDLCGAIHYDVDETTDGNCKAGDAATSQWDRWKGGGDCSLQHNSRVGTCSE
jgi:hypothetical protein